MSLRSLLYRLASLLGDWQAFCRGPEALAKRIVRKAVTKATSRAINRIIK